MLDQRMFLLLLLRIPVVEQQQKRPFDNGHFSVPANLHRLLNVFRYKWVNDNVGNWPKFIGLTVFLKTFNRP